MTDGTKAHCVHDMDSHISAEFGGKWDDVQHRRFSVLRSHEKNDVGFFSASAP